MFSSRNLIGQNFEISVVKAKKQKHCLFHQTFASMNNVKEHHLRCVTLFTPKGTTGFCWLYQWAPCVLPRQPPHIKNRHMPPCVSPIGHNTYPLHTRSTRMLLQWSSVCLHPPLRSWSHRPVLKTPQLPVQSSIHGMSWIKCSPRHTHTHPHTHPQYWITGKNSLEV